MKLLSGALVAGLLLQGAALADQRSLPTIDPTHACTAPQYPVKSRRMEQQGTVVLRFLIGADGVPQKGEIVSSSGYDELDNAARDALQLCHFRPAQIDGRPDPNPAWAQIRYTWKLQEAAGAPNPSATPAPAAQPFVLRCSANPSDTDFAEQLAAVEPQTPKIGGTARLALPPVGGASQTVCAERFYRALAESLRRSQLFDRLDVVETGIEDVRPRSEGEDFTLWVQGGALAVASRGGARAPIANNGQGLAAWARSLPQHLKQAQSRQTMTGYSMSASLIGGQPYIAYRGGEYLTTVDLVRHVRREMEEEARALPPPHGASAGKRLHVQLATEAAVIDRAEAFHAKAALLFKAPPSSASLSALAVSQLSMAMVGYTTAQGEVQALRQSGLYQGIDVEEGDAVDLPLGSYDAVMWNDPAAPMKWKVKDSLGVVHDLSATIPTLQAWLEAVRAALALGAVK